MPEELSSQLSDLADEFNGVPEPTEPDTDSSAPLEDGAITQVPDKSMMADSVPSQDIPSYVGEYSDTNPVEVESDDPQPVMIDEAQLFDFSPDIAGKVINIVAKCGIFIQYQHRRRDTAAGQHARRDCPQLVLPVKRGKT